MKRWTAAALAAASLISATAIAGTLAKVESVPSTHQTGAARWRAPEGSEKTVEYVPSNFRFDGAAGVAFVLP